MVPNMVVDACDLSTQKAEARGLKVAWATKRDPVGKKV